MLPEFTSVFSVSDIEFVRVPVAHVVVGFRGLDELGACSQIIPTTYTQTRYFNHTRLDLVSSYSQAHGCCAMAAQKQSELLSFLISLHQLRSDTVLVAPRCNRR